MPWRGHNGSHCRGCGRHRDECGPLSARYKCIDCGEGHMVANHRQLKAHDGPYFQHWRRKVALAVGASLLDDVPPRE